MTWIKIKKKFVKTKTEITESFELKLSWKILWKLNNIFITVAHFIRWRMFFVKNELNRDISTIWATGGSASENIIRTLHWNLKLFGGYQVYNS